MVNKTVQITFPQKAEMFCYFDGVPMPEVTWYKVSYFVEDFLGILTFFVLVERQSVQP